MTPDRPRGGTVFRVLDAMDQPHGGRILRLRLQEGEVPSVKDLKGARMRAVPPEGGEGRTIRVEGFAVFGGKPSDGRLARTGRIDVHVFDENGGDVTPVDLKWEVTGPLPE